MDNQIKKLKISLIIVAVVAVIGISFLAFWMYQETQNNDQANKEAFRQILENKLQIQKLEDRLSELNKKQQ